VGRNQWNGCIYHSFACHIIHRFGWHKQEGVTAVTRNDMMSRNLIIFKIFVIVLGFEIFAISGAGENIKISFGCIYSQSCMSYLQI